jgi:hypothetical protein
MQEAAPSADPLIVATLIGGQPESVQLRSLASANCLCGENVFSFPRSFRILSVSIRAIRG